MTSGHVLPLRTGEVVLVSRHRVDDSVDACVIGSGASGAIVAHTLVQHGLRVLLLEEGERLPDCGSLSDVEGSWERAFIRDGDGRWTDVGRPWTVRALGGGMSLFAGIAFRYRHVDFDASPYVAADALDPRWPIRYADLDTHYDEVEWLMGVARAAGSDPTEPGAGTVPMPPHPYSARGQLLAEAGQALGLWPFPTPLAINSVGYRGRPACNRCGPCNEYSCPSGAKASVVPLLLDPLRTNDLLTVATASKALKIKLTSVNRADAVIWLDLRTRRQHTTRARYIVLAANAVQSAALLLRSKNRWAPTGIGNRYDIVGRGLSLKVSGYAVGHVPERRMRRGPVNGPYSTVSFTDHYLDPTCPTGLGGVMYEASPAERSLGTGPTALRVHYLAGDQPMFNNRIRLAATRTEFGVEKIIMQYATHPIDARRLDYLAQCAIRLLEAAGAEGITLEESGYQRGSRHLHGTCRAGNDPRESVVDEQGRVHETDNVYVADGGFFPFAGGVNPTLTIQANALRIARHLLREFGPAQDSGMHVPVFTKAAIGG